MNKQLKTQVINALKDAGWGEFFAHESWAPGGIAMSGEKYTEEKGVAGDYWAGGTEGLDDFGINEEINTICAKFDCHTEWVNPGVFGIYH